MSSNSIKHLRDKYFDKEDSGYRLNKEAAKESVESVMVAGGLIVFAIVGGLAVIGLATIGMETVQVGAKTVKDGAVLVAKKLK